MVILFVSLVVFGLTIGYIIEKVFKDLNKRIKKTLGDKDEI